MLMRCLKKGFCAALALTAALSLATIARAQTQCTGTLNNPDVPCNLTVPPGATCVLDGGTVTGSVFVEQGGCLVVGQGGHPTTIGGNITATDAACLSIGFGSSVAGNVSAFGTTGDTPGYTFNFLCNSSIGGSVDIENSTSSANWCIGYTGSPCDCAAGEKIHGSLTFDNNAGGGIIGDNTITNTLACSGNTNLTCNGSSTSCNNNTAGTKSGQCSGF
jgi:hypothetical protein